MGVEVPTQADLGVALEPGPLRGGRRPPGRKEWFKVRMPPHESMTKWTIADIPSQKGKLSVVTGGNSGIGWYTALELARAGSEVILTARTEMKGRDAVERIRREVPEAAVRFELLDLASLHSVRTFAVKVGSETKVDLLVNNAGVMSVPIRRATEDGFELQFGTNFLGPFALTGLMLSVLKRAPSPRVTTGSQRSCQPWDEEDQLRRPAVGEARTGLGRRTVSRSLRTSCSRWSWRAGLRRRRGIAERRRSSRIRAGQTSRLAGRAGRRTWARS